MPEYDGLFFIGDPHLASRAPGTRKDDYPNKILRKFEWCLNYATEHQLLPCVLGDLFDKPKDNANWMIAELCAMLCDREVIAIYGNHDCKEDTLGEDDSLTILVKARFLKLVDEQNRWRGTIRGRDVMIGGTPYGTHLPQMNEIIWEGVSQDTTVFWMIHHDLMLPGYASGRIDLFEQPGIHVVVNGHVHSKCDPITKGKTVWINPGNIARVKRSSKDHVPAALGWTLIRRAILSVMSKCRTGRSRTCSMPTSGSRRSSGRSPPSSSDSPSFSPGARARVRACRLT